MAGRPKFQPTDEQRRMVESMAGYGLLHEDIALCVGDGIDPKTLRKHFRHELDTAPIKANAKVAEVMFREALNGNITAAIWWTKARMKWKETKATELGGTDGKPLNIQLINYADVEE